jgi:hypothetical protein
MSSPGMWRRVELVWTDVSEERLQSPAHAGSSLADFLVVYTKSTRSHIPEDGIVQSHRHENIKSYKKKYSIWRRKLQF